MTNQQKEPDPRLELEFTMFDFPEGLNEKMVAAIVEKAVKCAAEEVGKEAGKVYKKNEGVSPLRCLRSWPKDPEWPDPACCGNPKDPNCCFWSTPG